jgi:hypothetical protein
MLVWPRALFTAEAAKLLNQREVTDWNERCELLLDDAFVRGYAGGPLSEFREVAGLDPGSSSAPRSTMSAKQTFLRELMGNADQLFEDTLASPSLLVSAQGPQSIPDGVEQGYGRARVHRADVRA